jgi:hypothetical protein
VGISILHCQAFFTKQHLSMSISISMLEVIVSVGKSTAGHTTRLNTILSNPRSAPLALDC